MRLTSRGVGNGGLGDLAQGITNVANASLALTLPIPYAAGYIYKNSQTDVKPVKTVTNSAAKIASNISSNSNVTKGSKSDALEGNRNTLAYYQAEAKKMGKTGKAVSNYAYTKLKTRKRGNEGRTVATREISSQR